MLRALSRVGGVALQQAVLEDGDTAVAVLNFGAITRDWRVAVGNDRVPVVLGHADAARYLTDETHMGAIVGRVANRTAGGRFCLDGVAHRLTCNEGAHHLHGGGRGLGRRVWQMEADSAGRAVRLRYLSPDGEEGYPGRVRFTIDVSLAGGRLSYDMRAVPDRPTPINLAQHSYYNLMGAGLIWDHRLQVAADRFTPVDAHSIPTGQILPVAGTRYDFRADQKLGKADPARAGYDTNLVFTANRDPRAPAAELRAANGVRLRMWSDQPALQLYTGGHLGDGPAGPDGRVHRRFSGLCLEPQHFPDALNHAAFAPIIATPERPYRQRLAVEITAEGDPCDG